MERKIQKSYIYEGLGFPVKLINVPMRKFRGEYLLDVNLNELQKVVLLMLCYKKTPLTGNEVSFIRKYFFMTSTQFGDELGVSHVAVLKWEKYGDNIALIVPTTEYVIRLKTLLHLGRDPIELKALCESIELVKLAKYRENKNMKYIPISINAKEELCAA